MQVAAGTSTRVSWSKVSARANPSASGTSTRMSYAASYPWYACTPSDGDIVVRVKDVEIQGVISERHP